MLPLLLLIAACTPPTDKPSQTDTDLPATDSATTPTDTGPTDTDTTPTDTDTTPTDTDTETDPSKVDADGDGFTADEDCDDTDPGIHPDAYSSTSYTGVEIPNDGIDQDCDGEDACGYVCVGWHCGFETTKEGEAFCATWSQAAWLEIANVGIDLPSLEGCLCTPPEDLEVLSREDGVPSTLEGLDAWFPSEALHITGYGRFTFHGLEHLTEIPVKMLIECSGSSYNSLDLHFTGLENVERMAGLEFSQDGLGCLNTDTATDLSGLDSLRVVDGNFLIEMAPSIESLHGLESLEEVGGNLGVDGIDDIRALSRLRSVGGSIAARGAGDISSLAGLERVGDAMWIGGWSDQSVTLPDFAALTEVGGIYLYSVDASDLSTFSWIAELPAGLLLFDVGVPTFAGLENLASTGTLYLWANPNITNLAGLEGLRSVDSVVDIDSNPLLTSLDGLDGLTTIEGDLEITDNPLLTSLSGLHGVSHVGGDVTIQDNDSLSDAEIDALIDAIGRENIDGVVDVN